MCGTVWCRVDTVAIDETFWISAPGCTPDAANTCLRHTSWVRDAALALGGFVRFPAEQRSWDLARQGIIDALGASASEAAFRAGAKMSLDAALEYSRRANASPVAARSGWDSLTPTERAVVAQVAEGLTNAQAAKQLLMSPETVKTHLSRAFTKLAVNNRAELRLVAAQRATGS